MKWTRIGTSQYEINNKGQIVILSYNAHHELKRNLLKSYLLRGGHSVTLLDTTSYNKAILDALNGCSKNSSKLKIASRLAKRSVLPANRIIELLNTKKNSYYSKVALHKLVLGHFKQIYNILASNYNIVMHIEANNPHVRANKYGQPVYVSGPLKNIKLPIYHQGVMDFLVDDHSPIDDITQLVHIVTHHFDKVLHTFLEKHALLKPHNSPINIAIITKDMMAINSLYLRCDTTHIAIRLESQYRKSLLRGHNYVSNTIINTPYTKNKNQPNHIIYALWATISLLLLLFISLTVFEMIRGHMNDPKIYILYAFDIFLGIITAIFNVYELWLRERPIQI